MRNSRYTPKSKFFRPGPRRMFLPALPNVPIALRLHAGASSERQLRRVTPSASSVHGLNQRSGVGLGTRQSPITFGRSEPPPVLLSSRPEDTVNGRPPCKVRIPVICHPLEIAPITGLSTLILLSVDEISKSCETKTCGNRDSSGEHQRYAM